MAKYHGWTDNRAPCLNCQNRVIGCHSNCDKYKVYDESNKRSRAIKLKNFEEEYDFKNAICVATRKRLY